MSKDTLICGKFGTSIGYDRSSIGSLDPLKRETYRIVSLHTDIIGDGHVSQVLIIRNLDQYDPDVPPEDAWKTMDFTHDKTIIEWDRVADNFQYEHIIKESETEEDGTPITLETHYAKWVSTTLGEGSVFRINIPYRVKFKWR